MIPFEKDLIYEMRKLFGGFDEYEEYRKILREKLDKYGDQTSEEITASTTSTSTSNSTSTLELKDLESEISELRLKLDSYEVFQIKVLENTDSRAITDKENNVLFYYTIIDKEWLLFAESDEVLNEIKRRITEKKLTR